MPPRRRTLLLALGSVGVAGGAVGYSQRRRLRRRDDVAAIDAALEPSPPTIEQPVSVRPDHVNASYERAWEHAEQTERVAGDDPDRQVTRRLSDARDRLDANPPDAFADDDEHLEALDEYRIAVAMSATARGAAYGEHERNEPTDELRDRLDDLERELDAFEPAYRGEALSTVVVQYGEADRFRARAASSARRAARYLADDDFDDTLTWETVETGRTRVSDAELLVREREWSERSDALEAAFDRLEAETEDRRDDAIGEYADGVSTYALNRILDIAFDEPREHLEAGRPALAVRDQADELVTVTGAAAFDDVPESNHWDDLEYELDRDADELPEARTEAIDAIGAARDDVGDDPLGRALLRDVLDDLEHGDRTLERMRDDVNSADDRKWATSRSRAFLSYRAATAEAAVVPETVEMVHDVDEEYGE